MHGEFTEEAKKYTGKYIKYILKCIFDNRLNKVAGVFGIFTARCTLVQSAVLRSHVVCLSVPLSVCLSVCL